VKQAAVALYLDFKKRPIGEYNSKHNNLDIFLTASISLAAKIIGEYRTDQEFESKMFVSRERLLDAEERILRSFQVQDSAMPYPEFILQLAKRQVESMAENFAQRDLIGNNEKDELVRRSNEYLDAAFEKGLNPKTSYRGRAAGVMFKAVRDLVLHVSDFDIARAAGIDKKAMKANANVIPQPLKD
jgi:hypothetical protein